ncbi:MAG TPA: hypothetical protein VFQ47_03665 [Nitrososphaera sp.]|nr:hypothetical protein [Nitrososphaera sp.]
MAAATFVSMHIKMIKPLSNAKRKPEEILKSDEVSWSGILETEDYDELVYKLKLKYLRQGI